MCFIGTLAISPGNSAPPLGLGPLTLQRQDYEETKSTGGSLVMKVKGDHFRLAPLVPRPTISSLGAQSSDLKSILGDALPLWQSNVSDLAHWLCLQLVVPILCPAGSLQMVLCDATSGSRCHGLSPTPSLCRRSSGQMPCCLGFHDWGSGTLKSLEDECWLRLSKTGNPITKVGVNLKEFIAGSSGMEGA